MMRLALAMLLLFATAAFADERDDAEKLKAFRDINSLPAPHEFHMGWHFGYVQSVFRLFGEDWNVRFFYLPFLAPLPGSRLQDAAKIPNPFELTGTQYASTLPPMFDHDRSRAVERELRRIERITKNQQFDVKQ